MSPGRDLCCSGGRELGCCSSLRGGEAGRLLRRTPRLLITASTVSSSSHNSHPASRHLLNPSASLRLDRALHIPSQVLSVVIFTPGESHVQSTRGPRLNLSAALATTTRRLVRSSWAEPLAS